MKPLKGLRVVELAGIGPAPFACMMLADLGATVIQIRRNRAFASWHAVIDRGRSSIIELNLKAPGAIEIVHKLIAAADVVVEGFRPGVMERLGLGPSECLARNPKLVYARMTGWGQTGPLAQSAGHDINYLALTGALHAIGSPDRPVPPLNLLGDFGGGATILVTGILAALHSGQGQVVDCSIVDGTASLMSMLCAMLSHGDWSHDRASNLLDGGAPYYSVYECADGRYIAVGALEEQFYKALLETIGLYDLPDREERRNWPAIQNALSSAFKAKTRDEWSAEFADIDACVTPVLTLNEAAQHPHLQARQTYADVGGALHPAPPLRFSGIAPAPPELP